MGLPLLLQAGERFVSARVITYKDGLKVWCEDAVAFPWPHASGDKGWAFWNPNSKKWQLYNLEDEMQATTTRWDEVVAWCKHEQLPPFQNGESRTRILPPVLENETAGVVLRDNRSK